MKERANFTTKNLGWNPKELLSKHLQLQKSESILNG